MNLFSTEESLSPWEQYKKEHEISVTYCPEYNEYTAQSTLKGCHVFTGVGQDQRAAINTLCFDAPIPTFDEWRMMKGGSNG